MFNFYNKDYTLKKEAQYFINIGKNNIDKCALIILCGGQGTRLGHNGPKGTYRICNNECSNTCNLEEDLKNNRESEIEEDLKNNTNNINNNNSNNIYNTNNNINITHGYSLYEIIITKLKNIELLYNKYFYIIFMTSEYTHEETVKEINYLINKYKIKSKIKYIIQESVYSIKNITYSRCNKCIPCNSYNNRSVSHTDIDNNITIDNINGNLTYSNPCDNNININNTDISITNNNTDYTCIENRIKISEDSYAKSPNGNGGIFKALYKLYLEEYNNNNNNDIKDSDNNNNKSDNNNKDINNKSNINNEIHLKDIKYFNVSAVDNVLSNIIDPLAIGISIDKGLDILSKGITLEDDRGQFYIYNNNDNNDNNNNNNDNNDNNNNTVKSDNNTSTNQIKNKIRILEYSEINDKNNINKYKDYKATGIANICDHYFSSSFIKTILSIKDNKDDNNRDDSNKSNNINNDNCNKSNNNNKSNNTNITHTNTNTNTNITLNTNININNTNPNNYTLSIHYAYKKISYFYNNKIISIKEIEENNGYKQELFIFDIFKYTDKNDIMIVPKILEYSPLKNQYNTNNNKDNEYTCQRDIIIRNKIINKKL